MRSRGLYHASLYESGMFAQSKMDIPLEVVKSFVHPSPSPTLGKPEFDVVATTHLTKNANFRPHNFAPYFFNFIMAAVMMVPETKLKLDLGVERGFWKIMPDKVGVKFVFFVTLNDKLTMQIRNVFLTDDFEKWQRGLSSIEYSTLKERVRTTLGDISLCEKHVEEYAIKDYELYQEGKKVGNRQKMPMMVRKLHTVNSIIFTDDSKERDDNFRPLRQQLVSRRIDPETHTVIKPLEEKIRQLNNAPEDKYVEKVQSLLSTLVSIYQEAKKEQSVPFEEWNGADCGFLHGAMLALSEKVNLVPTVQHHMLPGNYDTESGRVGRFYLALHPIFEPEAQSVSKVGVRLPIAISFTQDLSSENADKLKRFDWFMMRRASLHDANWSDKVMLTQLNFKDETNARAETRVDDAIRRQEILNNFELFYDRIIARKEEFSAEKFVEYIQSIMDSIRYTGVPHDISETNYVSRYFLSMLASIHALREHNLETFVFKPQNDEETHFLIKSRDNEKVKIIIKIIEKPMPEKRRKSTLDISKILGDPVVTRPVRSSDDTIILTISQEYQHSQSSFITKDNVEDFINREISINYGTFSQLSHDPESMNSVEPFRVDTGLLFALVDNEIEEFGEDLQSFLNDYSPYLNRRSSFQAFVDGLFHSTKYANRIVPLRSFDSANQMAISTPIETPEAVENHLTVFNFMYTQDPAADNSARSKGAFSTIKRRLRGAKNHILNIVYNMARGTATTMIDRGPLSAWDCMPRKKRQASGNCFRKKTTSIEDTEAYHEFPETKVALKALGQVSNGIMAGLMLRDFIADLIRGDNKAALRDASFFGGALLSGRMAAVAEMYAVKMMESGKFLVGNSLKAVAPILRRVTSLYVLSGLIDAVEAYSKNKNSTEALVNIVADSSFLAVDGAETGIEVLELFDVVEGISAITGPIGMTIGAVLLCGTTVYETVRKMKSLNAQVHLTPFEELDETFRAMLHLDIEQEVKQGMQRHQISQILYEVGIKILASEKSLKYYVTPTANLISGKLKYTNISVMDLRYGEQIINVDRASPSPTNKNVRVFCKLTKHSTDDVKQHLSTWQKVKFQFNDLVTNWHILVDYIRGDSNAMLQDVAHHGDVNLESGYPCFESFGIENLESTSDVAYFQLGDGFRKIYGFPNKSNVFNCTDGIKVLNGGDKNDNFILSGDAIEGALFGDDGMDHLDLSRFYLKGAVRIQEHGVSYHMDKKKIILQNTKGCHDNSQDEIFVNKNSSCEGYNSTIVLSTRTYVDNDAPLGIFNYIVPDSEQRNIKLIIREVGTNEISQNILYLKAEPLIFTADKSGQIYLTNEDIHENQVIHVRRRLQSSYEFYQLNQTLIISNLDKKLFWDLNNQITIVLENFFIRPKFQTLKFVFLDGAKITIVGHLFEIAKASPIDDLWRKVITNDVFYYEN
uniref:Uncharacterized protein n=1 Tax=Romanomermis culicivorax TaxID=13658 RepID=A0A915IH51_ROMCU